MSAAVRVPLSFSRPTPASRAKAVAQVMLDATRAKAERASALDKSGMLAVLQAAERRLMARRLAMAVAGGETVTPTIADALLAQVREVTLAMKPDVMGVLGRVTRANAKLGVTSSAEMLALFEGQNPGALRPLAVVESIAASRTVLERHESSVDRYGLHILGRFRRVMQEGVLLGDTFDDMTARLRSEGGTVLPTRGWAERIVRTEGMSALNAGAFEEMKEQRKSKPDLLKKLIETFDARTAEDSYTAHGEIRELEDFFIDGKGRTYLHPPGRPHDRGVVIPWRRAWTEPDAEALPVAPTPPPPEPEPTLPPVAPAPEPPPPAPVVAPPAPPSPPAPVAPEVPRTIAPRAFLPALRNVLRHGSDTSPTDEVRTVTKGLLRSMGLTDFDVLEGRPSAGVLRLAAPGEDVSVAEHRWDGSTVFGRKKWTQARRAAFRLQRGDIADLPPGELNAITTLIHEELHGHSPILPGAYVGHGVGLEEAVTEALARVAIRDAAGMKRGDVLRGVTLPTYDGVAGRFKALHFTAYDEYIEDLYEAAHRTTKGDAAGLPGRMEAAMVRLRSGGYRGLATPEAHFEAMADALGHAGKGAELQAQFAGLQRARAALAEAPPGASPKGRTKGARGAEEAVAPAFLAGLRKASPGGVFDYARLDDALYSEDFFQSIVRHGLWDPDAAALTAKGRATLGFGAEAEKPRALPAPTEATKIAPEPAPAGPAPFDPMAKAAGPSRGTNEGGTFVGSDGVKRYVKLYADPTQAMTEHLANVLYADLGVPAPTSIVFQHEGKTAFASTLIEDAKPLGQVGITKERAREALRGFGADLLTGNRDAIGWVADNVVITKAGAVVRVDQGSAFLHGAKGDRKSEADRNSLSEWEGFADPKKNKRYAELFDKAGVRPADLAPEVAKTVARAKDIAARPGGWGAYVDRHAPALPPGDRAAVVTMLETRTRLLDAKVEAIEAASSPVLRALPKVDRTHFEALEREVAVPGDVSKSKFHADNHAEVWDKLDADQRAAVKRFSHQYDWAIRQLDKGRDPADVAADVDRARASGDVKNPPDGGGAEHVAVAQKAREDLYGAMRALKPRPGVVYRGMKGLSEEAAASLLASETFVFDAVSSTSYKASTALEFLQWQNTLKGEEGTYKVLLRIDQKSGRAIEAGSHYPTEAEILVSKGARFRVTKREAFEAHGGGLVPGSELDEQRHVKTMILHLEEIDGGEAAR